MTLTQSISAPAPRDVVRHLDRENLGLLIVNADDWGRDRRTTDMARECVRQSVVSSVSAMVFMDDSERAASIAREQSIDTGLHINLTTPFSGGASRTLIQHQARVTHYLRRHKITQALYHPGLSCSFEYVVATQLDEYRRLYGADPSSVDGHHHMHLCANVLIQKLLPAGSLARRSFSFMPGEKPQWNRVYRKWVDNRLARRHMLVDYFFALAPLDPERLKRIIGLARHFIVELETHPVERDEHAFLCRGKLSSYHGPAIVPHSAVVIRRRSLDDLSDFNS